MNIENGIIAGLVFVLVMQALRQFFPNVFSYIWQEYACSIVPVKYRNLHWFNNKNSLLYVDKQNFRFERFAILTQSNARSVTLYFAFVFWIFATQPLVDIRGGTQALLTLLTFTATGAAMGTFAWRVANGNANPDVFITTVFNAVSIVISFSISLLILSN